MEFCISPPEKTSWKMTPSEFADHLLSRWPAAEVRTTHDPALSPRWEIEMPGGNLMGYFYPPLSGVMFDSYSSEDSASFALWFRSLVPISQQLLFYDQGFNWDMELKPTTTVQEILVVINGG